MPYQLRIRQGLIRPITAGMAGVAVGIALAGPAVAAAAPPSATGTVSTMLSGVACANARHCWAVGDRTSSGHTRAMIEQLRAGRWSRVATPQPPRSADAILDGVTCVGSADCWAVGDYQTPAGHFLPATEHWNGHRWAVVKAPFPAGSPLNTLTGVSCAKPTMCMAVGPYLNGTLAERWNGRKWLLGTGPSAGEVSDLDRVACPSANDCWAAGYYVAPPSGGGTITAHWDGSSWSDVTTTTSNSVGTHLIGAACHGTASCFTVGGDSPSQTTLTEQWAGSAWSVVASPSVGASQLVAVSCPGASSCMAVGSGHKATTVTLAERWNGSAWSVVSTPSPRAPGGSTLHDVACVSASNCWAVGASTAAGARTHAFTEHWNGKKWSLGK